MIFIFVCVIELDGGWWLLSSIVAPWARGESRASAPSLGLTSGLVDQCPAWLNPSSPTLYSLRRGLALILSPTPLRSPPPLRLSSSFMAASKADLLPYFASALMTISRPHRPIFMAWELKNNNQNNKNNAFSHECLSIEPCGSSVGVSGMKAKFPVSCPCCTLLPRLHAV